MTNNTRRIIAKVLTTFIINWPDVFVQKSHRPFNLTDPPPTGQQENRIGQQHRLNM